uniref:Uncharacterized protein n=1 Tax=Anguilla anguilla TaxID=7936 RepID=A0A0E9XGW0_ANGAN
MILSSVSRLISFLPTFSICTKISVQFFLCISRTEMKPKTSLLFPPPGG